MRVAADGVSVVTGASSGIGEALARLLAARGHRLVLLARREERLRALAAELDAVAEVCDVAERAQVEAVASRHPRVSLLVNNAGVPCREDFLAASAEAIEQVTRVNYLGSVWCLRAFLPALEAARPSRVVNVVSVSGTVAFPPSAPYSAAKHAQLAFSRATRAQLAPRGIAVQTVNPGFTATEGFPQTPLVASPLLRWLVETPEGVAAAIVRALDGNRAEITVPWWFRPAGLLQTAAPGLLASGAARFLWSRLSGAG